MKQTILKLALFLLPATALFSSCREKDDLVKPIPQTPPPPPDSMQFFQLTMDSLPGEPIGPVNTVFASVKIINAANDTVFIEKKLPVAFQDGKFKTRKAELPFGDYRVVQFLIINGDNRVKAATPVINSAKASMVSKPLPLAFNLTEKPVLSVPIEIVKVEPADTPESFGYPAGLFKPVPGDNGQPDFKIKIRLRIQVGALLYDSIPGTVLYSAWDEQQQHESKYITLAAGANDIAISPSAVKHHFRITKWSAEYELTLSKNEIQEGALYIIGGTKEAKKLKQQLTYKLVNGAYVPEKKMAFSYGSDGKLSGIEHYLKNPDNSTYLAMSEVFQYSNNSLERINRYDQQNQPAGYIYFSYNAAGKVSSMTESANGNVTTATVSYLQVSEDMDDVFLTYRHSNTSNIGEYIQRYYQGSVISDYMKTAINNTEEGTYRYDDQINPRAHIGWPDLFLSNESKNNRVSQHITYYGSYPGAVPFKFEYTYDAEGYPAECITYYKAYMTNTFLYTIKTVYTY